MIPTWTSAFTFICTLNPSNLFFLIFATYTISFFSIPINVWIFIDFGIGLIFLFLLFCHLSNFFNLLALNIFEHDSFETEGVKKSSLSQRLDLLRINCSNEISIISDLNDFRILRYLRDFLMWRNNSLNK